MNSAPNFSGGSGAAGTAAEIFGQDAVTAGGSEKDFEECIQQPRHVQRPPIIVLFGFSFCGKTALTIRLQRQYINKGHYNIDPTIDRLGPKERTTNIQPYWFTSTRGNRSSFILVDLPGEKFQSGLDKKFNDESSITTLRLMAAADAYIFLLEADKLLFPNRPEGSTYALSNDEREQHAKASEAIIAFTTLDWHLQREVRKSNDVAAAVQKIISMPEKERKEIRRKAVASSKPVLLALSKADVLYSMWPELERAERAQGRDPTPDDEDLIQRHREAFDVAPLYSLKRYNNTLFNQINNCFRNYRVDFTTSFAGMRQDFKGRVDDAVARQYPPFGIEANFDWLCREARRRNSFMRRLVSRVPGAIDFWDDLPSARDTRYAVAARRLWDEDFRHAR